MNKTHMLAVAALLIAPAMTYAGAFESGASIVKAIEAMDRTAAGTATTTDWNAANFFHGYVLGVIDTASDTRLCPSGGTSSRQADAIVRKYVLSHPEEWNYSAAGLVIRALSPVWPCGK
jgi:hypothetical protein